MNKNKKRNSISNERCYVPSNTLRDYLEERLQFQRAKSSDGSAAGEPESRQFNYVLNNIVFPSMANVIYFLEQVSKHVELQQAFDDEIKELLGFVTNDGLRACPYCWMETKDEESATFDSAKKLEDHCRQVHLEKPLPGYEPPIRRLIDSILGWHSTVVRRKGDGKNEWNFRLAMMCWMQEYLSHNIRSKQEELLSDLRSRELIGHDLARVLLWTELMQKMVDDKPEKVTRPVRF